jgi:RimJ/RimL family protein N-acetyltransferase
MDFRLPTFCPQEYTQHRRYEIKGVAFDRYSNAAGEHVYVKDGQFFLRQIDAKAYEGKLFQIAREDGEERSPYFWGTSVFGDYSQKVTFGLFCYDTLCPPMDSVTPDAIETLDFIGFTEGGIPKRQQDAHKMALNGSYIQRFFRKERLSRLFYQARADWAQNKNITMLYSYPHENNWPSRKAAEAYGFQRNAANDVPGKWGIAGQLDGMAVCYELILS